MPTYQELAQLRNFGERSGGPKYLRVSLLEKFSYIFECMYPINQFFDFLERGEHAMVNLHPYFALKLVQMCIMSELVHAVYSGNNFHTHVSLRFLPLWVRWLKP